MDDSENIIGKITDNKKVIGENIHVMAIVFLIAFIIIDIIIIVYLINENDKFHTIFTEVTRKESIQIRDYLVAEGVEAFINEAGQVVVAKENVNVATVKVNNKFFPENIIHSEDLDESFDVVEENLTPTEIVLEISQLEQSVTDSLENHVAIKKAIVRIENYKSDIYDVDVAVVITIENGMELKTADLDTIEWLILNLVTGLLKENLILINQDTNQPF